MSQTAKKQVPIREGLFEVLEDGPHLTGSRCRECGEVTFPANAFCPQCCTETTENVSLSRRGTLYSFTVQRFKPPPPYRAPDPFVPYGVGMIELPEGLRVTAVLEEGDPERLRVGMEMELVLAVFFEDDEGNEVLGYRFRAVTDKPPDERVSR
ncbi:MAG TPA: OB-fold domain-containing protein [Blastocatellia bacterium]|nr:OB-fold domain-containing protein [Blastocatellia bacterium]